MSLAAFAASVFPVVPIALADRTAPSQSTCRFYGDGNIENVGKMAESALAIELEDGRDRRRVHQRCAAAVRIQQQYKWCTVLPLNLLTAVSVFCQAENELPYRNRTRSSNALPREGVRRHTRSTSHCRSRQHERKPMPTR